LVSQFYAYVGFFFALMAPKADKAPIDGPYNKDLTIKTSGSRGLYGKVHAHF
jgi:hypothetical protein